MNLKFLSFCFFFLRDGESKISLCYPRGLGASPSVFSQTGLRNLMRVECLEMINMIKPIVVGFCSI